MMRILVVGGGTAGWMTAAALIRVLGSGASVRLVESEEIGTVGVGEATVPALRAFNDALGIPEAEFVREVQGTFKLGIRFVGWGEPTAHYLHGFGPVGPEIGFPPFHHYWLRARRSREVPQIGAYSLHAVAAERGRFMTSATDAPPQSPLANIAHAYHFDAARYAAYLRRYAESRGVVRTEGRIVEVSLGAEGGQVEAVRLGSGERIEADLFVDCSGFAALLIGRTLGVGFRDWSHWLPCDRALTVATARSGAIEPYTCATARPAGWQWRIPLQHRRGNGYVYSSAFASEDQARETLLGNLEGAPHGEPRLLSFRTGRRERFWYRNCVAIGLASAFLEPLESTSIYLIQAGVNRLVHLLPRASSALAEREYNREMITDVERIRDFVILHYATRATADSELWQYCRHMSVPDPLAERIELFRESGHIVHDVGQMFGAGSYLQVLLGQGVMPRSHHPGADVMPEAELERLLAGARTVIENCVGVMPAHERFIERHCAAAAA
jgi:tryptophan halogenase